MKVVFARIAEESLEQIADYIAHDNPVRAMSFIAELREAAMGLGQMVNAFPLVPNYEGLGIRRRPHDNYLIYYRVEADRALILLIAHGARDIGNLLLPRGIENG